MKRIGLLLALLLMPLSELCAAMPEIADMVRLPEFKSAHISPNGNYLALAAPSEKQTGLAILDISQYPKLKLISAYKFSPFEHVEQVTWANNERVLFTTSIQRGTLNRPRMTGRLFAMNADGSNRMMLYGTDFNNDFVFKYFDIIDLLLDDPEHILVAFYAHDRERPIATRININNGRRNRDVGSPLENGGLYADSQGAVRFAQGWTVEGKARIAYREDANADWQEPEVPFEDDFVTYGFTFDDKAILVDVERPGQMGIYRLNPADVTLEPVLVNENVEASEAIYEIGKNTRFVGTTFEDGKPYHQFIDETEPTAKLYRMLEESFPGDTVTITSSTWDGQKAIVAVSSDRAPANFYLFDVAKKQVAFLVSTRSWIDPEQMAARTPISFTARDGRRIHGYLTLPNGVEPKNLPMITVVHGGPHGPRDSWNWDMEPQLLASRGYAVLQVNFRGSGGYGDEFERAGYRHWGTSIQDDITDGVAWAVAQGIADENRLCIYGGSFGGYSVVQSMVREPALYKCGFAFVGIYDMNLMFEEGDIPASDYGINYLEKVLGTDEKIRAAQSPLSHLDKLQGALYVAHGKEDVRAHVEHYYRLIEALEKQKIPHRKLLVKNEGHGFYEQENRVKLYSELLNFIDTHIGKPER